MEDFNMFNGFHLARWYFTLTFIERKYQNITKQISAAFSNGKQTRKNETDLDKHLNNRGKSDTKKKINMLELGRLFNFLDQG